MKGMILFQEIKTSTSKMSTRKQQHPSMKLVSFPWLLLLFVVVIFSNLVTLGSTLETLMGHIGKSLVSHYLMSASSSLGLHRGDGASAQEPFGVLKPSCCFSTTKLTQHRSPKFRSAWLGLVTSIISLPRSSWTSLSQSPS